MAAAEGVPPNLVFVDLETTGGNAALHRITEIGLVRMENGELVEEWSSLVNPDCPIPPHIEAFTGITDAMVADAPRFADLAPLLREKLRGAVFVAHNARFDYAFMRSEFRRLDAQFSADVLCTVKLSRRLFPTQVRHNLDAVMQRHGLSCSARHRALGDARVLRDFWCTLRRELPEQALAAAVREARAIPKLPAHLPADLADDLPQAPGVYRFFGEGDSLLYVGKAHSLRTRVMSHFTPQRGESTAGKLADLVRRVDWLETAGDLGAMLHEISWLKSRQPALNHRRAANTPSFTLRMRAGAAAADCAAPIRVEPIDAENLRQCFGVFHSEKDARKAVTDIARAKELCLKVLGVEDGAGSCIAYQFGKCRGACTGKESLLMHDVRVRLALSPLKLKAWPFPGRIALRERGAASGAGGEGRLECHVLDRWAFLGTARSDEDLEALRAAEVNAVFDIDVYKILQRFFANHPKIDWHDLRGQTLYS